MLKVSVILRLEDASYLTPPHDYYCPGVQNGQENKKSGGGEEQQ